MNDVTYNNAVTILTKVLYDSINWLVHIAFEVKQYVASIYGAHSMQAEQANHIPFRTLVKKPRKKK